VVHALEREVDRVVDLGGDHHFFAARAGEQLREAAAGDLLRSAARVGVGGVEEVDATLHRLAEKRP
jgi:hypothetical protein